LQIYEVRILYLAEYLFAGGDADPCYFSSFFPCLFKNATVLLSISATTTATIATAILPTQTTINATTCIADITTYPLDTFSVADRHTAKQTTDRNQIGCNSTSAGVVA
jgi:hypothetical protein